MRQLPGRKWQARWVWADGIDANTYTYLRGRFELPAGVTGARLFVTADTRYELWLDGVFVGRGAPQSQPFYHYYDHYELSAELPAGAHCLAAVVNYTGKNRDTRPGFLLELLGPDGQLLAATGPSWRGRRSPAWATHTYHTGMNQAVPYQEHFDARREPEGWREPDFDDSRWADAEVIAGRLHERPPAAGPWCRLVPRDIPFMTDEVVRAVAVGAVEECLDIENRPRREDLSPGLSQVGQPLQYTRVEDPEALCDAEGATVVQSSRQHLESLDFDGTYSPTILLDFGKVVTARVELEVEGPAGAMIDMGYAERLIDGRFNNALECEFADRYTLKDGPQRFTTFGWKAFRYLKLRLRNCTEALTLHQVQGRISTYPYTERGSFRSTDERLNAVWGISRETLRLCSNEFLMDTPWREQAQWLGDVALVTVPGIHSCFGDSRLTRKFLMQAGQNQHPTGMISNVSNMVNHQWQGAIPDYSLWWLHALLWQYQYAGDQELLHRLYPQALRVLDGHLYYLNEAGLLEDLPWWVFIDWADTDRQGICTAYNAIFYSALEALRQLAAFRGDSYAVRLTSELRARLAASFHDWLFDPARQCYADARVDGEFSAKVSEHANLAPICAGLTPETVGQELVRRIFESPAGEVRFTEAQPFFMAVVLGALDRLGRGGLALKLIERRWGRRMLDHGATSTFEEWYQNGSWRSGTFHGFLRSHSHAWSAIPADFLIRRLLGLEILEPGCRKVRVSPKVTDFDYELTFPTPAGAIHARCQAGRTSVTGEGPVEIERADTP